MTLDDIGLYSRTVNHPDSQRPLHAQARCVCSLIRRYLPRLKNKNAWKINVYVQNGPVEDPVITANGIASVSLTRDLDSFYELDDTGKKQFVFDALLEGAKVVSEHHDWPTSDITEAFDKAAQDRLENEWRFQPKWNPSRNLRAHVRCAHELDSFRAWLCVEDRDGKPIAEQHLFEETPEESCYMPRLGTVSWTDKSTVHLADRSGARVGDQLRIELGESQAK